MPRKPSARPEPWQGPGSSSRPASGWRCWAPTALARRPWCGRSPAGYDSTPALIYKYHSSYFQQFIGTPGLIRYVGDTEVVELNALYRIRGDLAIHIDGINLFDEPKKQSIPITGNLAELNSYGPRFFVGLRYRP